MRPLNQNEVQANVAMRYRTLRTVWFGILLSVPMYYVYTLLEAATPVATHETQILTTILLPAGIASVLVSHIVKRKILSRSVSEQRVQLVHIGYVTAFAVTEVAALLGVLDHFLTGNRYYYILFIVAAIGLLSHFPNRDHLLAACYKQ